MVVTNEFLSECFRLLDDGVLVWRERPDRHFSSPSSALTTNRQHSGRAAGTIGKDGYILVRVADRLYPAHQIVWCMTHGDWPSGEIDHANGNRKNNRPANLRLARRSDNMANMKIHSDSVSGVKGVTYHPQTGKWRARIYHGKKQIHLGLHASKELAGDAYANAARKIHGQFARTR